MKHIGKKLSLLLLASSSLFASIDIQSIDVFNNKTFVNQKIDVNKNSVELLGQVRLDDIRFLVGKECKVNSSDIKLENFKGDELTKQIELVKDAINSKESGIKALKSNISFLEKTTLSGKQDLKEASKFLKSEILDNYETIYKIEKELKKEKEKLNELNKKRANSRFSRLNYDISCSKDISISYPIYKLFRNGFYEINYDSKLKKIDIKNSSFITQSTGVDFKNIDINLYTYNYVRTLKPNKFYPKYLDLYPEPVAYARADVMMEAMPVKKMAKSSPKPTFAYVEDTTKSFFKASNVTLLSGKKTEVIFAKDNYEAKDSLEIDGYSQSKPFYKVDFKSKRLYGVLNSKLYLDGTYIGRTNLGEIKKDKKSSIYFGENRFIHVKKELIKDMKEEPFFSLNKLKTQKLWSYKITNKQDKIQKITLLERVPVSKHEDIKVKLIGKTKEKKLDKNGKIYFEIELKPNESKTIEFGYEIEKPNKS